MSLRNLSISLALRRTLLSKSVVIVDGVLLRLELVVAISILGKGIAVRGGTRVSTAVA